MSMQCCLLPPNTTVPLPGALKNAIDWASRPWGQNAFSRKPSGVVGTSPGSIGTAVAQQHLRSVLCFCNSPLMNTMEVYLQTTPDLIDDDGNISNPSTADFLRKYMQEYALFVQRVLTVLPRES
ncbi:NADPH-dependent FMN reductase [Thermomonas sp.]|uniref:NADPH-dependent FMN reductase n=1 Tax=Thermomonas sp. TaxID=1971895 RepID=UPI0035AE9E8C